MSKFFEDKFKNYQEQPSPELWESINADTKNVIKRKHNQRVAIISAISLAVIAGAGLLINNALQQDVQGVDNVKFTQKANAVSNTNESTNAVEITTNETKVQMPQQKAETIVAVNGEKKTVEEQIVSKVVENQNVDAEKKVAKVTVTETKSTNIEPKAIQVVENTTNADKHTAKVKTSTGSDSVIHRDNTESKELWIPNAFTPDQGSNNRFYVTPINANNIKDYEIRIFSRNGMMVYHSKTITDSWDGVYRGTKLQAGAYVYVITYTDASSQKHNKRGSINLIR